MTGAPETEGGFCVVCGRTGRPLEGGVCADCAMDRAELVRPPGRAVVVLCPTCGARWIGAHWEASGRPPHLTPEDLLPLVELHPELGVRSVDWREVQANATIHEFRATARVRFRGVERTIEFPLTVRLEQRSCQACSRRSGHYYTAVLQLRGPADGPREKAEALRTRLEAQWTALLSEARSDWRGAIAWTERRPEGWDVYAQDTLAARSLARLAKQRLEARIQESATLVGRKNGVDVYRVTFCVRIPREAGRGRRPVGRLEQYP
ncbi:MAG: 60S ribosomal export protein NMD3 [Thermoplasmata archaeon]